MNKTVVTLILALMMALPAVSGFAAGNGQCDRDRDHLQDGSCTLDCAALAGGSHSNGIHLYKHDGSCQII